MSTRRVLPRVPTEFQTTPKTPPMSDNSDEEFVPKGVRSVSVSSSTTVRQQQPMQSLASARTARVATGEKERWTREQLIVLEGDHGLLVNRPRFVHTNHNFGRDVAHEPYYKQAFRRPVRLWLKFCPIANIIVILQCPYRVEANAPTTRLLCDVARHHESPSANFLSKPGASARCAES